jgi:shikimate 5-dehydrogenase
VETVSFVGVTTAKSTAMRMFPAWAEELGLGEVRLVGKDLPIHAERHLYREAVQAIKEDEHNRGALITTHKIDLFEASRDLFDRIDESARLTGETSCLYKRDGLFCARATDPVAAGRALREFLPDDHWQKTGGEVLCLGAGGAAIAITLDLTDSAEGPARITVVNRSPARLEALRGIHAGRAGAAEFVFLENADPLVNDQLVGNLPPGSLVINATGMGKDTPGSPITDAAEFPQGAYAWELNYRGELAFLHQAHRQDAKRRLHVHDGWRYFIHGWATVIEGVFNLDITEAQLSRLAALAESERSKT